MVPPSPACPRWALTMLSPKNVDKASVCNSVGQSLGYFVSFILFLILSDPKTCNKYLRCVEQAAPDTRLPRATVFPPLTIFALRQVHAVRRSARDPRRLYDLFRLGLCSHHPGRLALQAGAQGRCSVRRQGAHLRLQRSHLTATALTSAPYFSIFYTPEAKAGSASWEPTSGCGRWCSFPA